MTTQTTTEGKYWKRVSLDALADDLDECVETPVLVLGVLKRLLGEVQRLQADNDQLHHKINGLERNVVTTMDAHGWL